MNTLQLSRRVFEDVEGFASNNRQNWLVAQIMTKEVNSDLRKLRDDELAGLRQALTEYRSSMVWLFILRLNSESRHYSNRCPAIIS